MKSKLYFFLLTALMGLFGMNAWAQDYEITCAEDLMAFADLVNGGETSANAVLTDDIDLTDVLSMETWAPIGSAEKMYTGTFDGQGHAITGFEYTATGPNNGLFGAINNATVKDFSISGTLTSVGYTYNGVIGQAEGTSVISGIYSALDINVSNFKAHTGGIVGGMTTGSTMEIRNCEYAGTLTHSGAGDCQAGICGYTYGGGIFNCIFSGTIIGENNKYGGIIGYCKIPAFKGVQNCLSIGKIVANDGCTTAAAIIANWNGGTTANVKNNYYCLQEGSTTTIAIGNKASACEAPHSVTAEQLKSGEVCYLLNGDQSNIAFYQTLNDDEVPVLDATHSVVYLAGRSHCDGTPYEGVTGYSNTASVVDNHDFVDGFCTYCDALDEDYSMTPNAEGYYEIGSANQLRWFAAIVNGGEYTANAILVDDIDMTGKPWPKPLGDWASGNVSTAYAGHFDGQGHAITNLEYAAVQNYHGFFGVITTGAVIENFSIGGKITSTTQYVGVVSYARETPIIRNVHSYLNITNTYSGGRQGGIVGGSMNGTVTIDRCTYSGSFTIDEQSGNYGGIVGYVNNNSLAIVNITNCLFDGELNNGTAGGQCGGIVGYNNGGKATITNCLSIGSLTSGAAGQFFGALNGNNSTYHNNYYLGTVPQTGSGTPKGEDPIEVTTDQLASEEIVLKLGIAFRQNLDTDPYPVLDATHNVVTEITEAGYATLFVDNADLTVPEGVVANTGLISDESLVLKAVGNAIAVGEPVVLKGAAGVYSFVPTTGAVKAEDNDLVGAAKDVEANGQYILAKPAEGEVGFYKATTGTIKAGKAYLQSNAGVKAFFFNGDDATGIEETLSNSPLKGENVYNLAGQRMSKMHKGINIVDGKKILK